MTAPTYQATGDALLAALRQPLTDIVRRELAPILDDLVAAIDAGDRARVRSITAGFEGRCQMALTSFMTDIQAHIARRMPDVLAEVRAAVLPANKLN